MMNCSREDRGTSPCQIFLKLVYPKQRYGDFSIFKLATAVLDFWNREFYRLTGSRGSKRTSMPNIVNICQSVAKILRFFDFLKTAAADPPPSWIVEFSKFYWLTVSGGIRRVTVPSFAQIGLSVAAILRFFEVLKWTPLPSWIFEIAKFYWLLRSRGSRRINIAYQILWKSVNQLQRY